VLTLTVPSAVLNYDIDTELYLPPCYASSGERYPVLYLIHGLNFTEDQWVRLGVADAADAMSADGEIAPLIIVMPRDRKDTRFDPAFVTDLVPYIDATYRTKAEAGYRAIGGLSRGGGWSIHLGLRYPQLFGRVGAHSPAVFFGDETNVLAYARAVAKTGPVPALYVDVGEDDANRQSAAWLDQVFTWFNFGQTYLVQPGGHTEKYWSSHIDDYLRFYAAAWRLGLNPATPTPSLTPDFE
jgi:enterochelin esterase-like enzyme